MTLDQTVKKYAELRALAVGAAYRRDAEALNKIGEALEKLPTFCCCPDCLEGAA